MSPEERREREREYERRYREVNREKIVERQRRYREANREKRREYNRRWRQANPDKEREANRRWVAANPEKAREHNRRYKEANRQKGRVAQMARNHGLSPQEWAALWDAQQGLCYLCEQPMTPAEAHLDHDHSCCPQNRSCRYCRRGVAHRSCNTGIGLAGDDPDKLQRWADNLRMARSLAAERIAAARPVQPSLFSEDGSQEAVS